MDGGDVRRCKRGDARFRLKQKELRGQLACLSPDQLATVGRAWRFRGDQPTVEDLMAISNKQ
eukprot:64181-Pyramimonas_sp.AAC.1